ncbi:MAG TPA: SET domain-containing protein-lysine N-methyltransferase [Candidatus Acidoferrales bacterium]|nr:SET domain-containing protein-lysine N-methyltransferase [Candidatus Acidoferrales bacterium]
MKFPSKIPGLIMPPHSKFRLRIGRSKIHRWGVFALETIARGRQVIEYTGDRLTLKQAQRRFIRNYRRRRYRANVYFARFRRNVVIDGFAGQSGAQFINHCCDPNLSVRRIRGHLLLFSRRRIRPGQELFSDYAYKRDLPKIPCRCGSRKCRGFMNRK